jgi:hypothetical protein
LNCYEPELNTAASPQVGTALIVPFPRLLVPVYWHHVSGRLRLQMAELKGDAAVTEATRRRLSTIPGVTAVRTSERIGSITLEYDPQVLTLDQLVMALRQRGVRFSPRQVPARSGPPRRASFPLAQAAVETVAKTLLEIAVQRAAMAIFTR